VSQLTGCVGKQKKKSKKNLSAAQVTFYAYQAFLCFSLPEFFLCLSGIFMLISAQDASIHACHLSWKCHIFCVGNK
jgi:hypothetical protein